MVGQRLLQSSFVLGVDTFDAGAVGQRDSAVTPAVVAWSWRRHQSQQPSCSCLLLRVPLVAVQSFDDGPWGYLPALVLLHVLLTCQLDPEKDLALRWMC